MKILGYCNHCNGVVTCLNKYNCSLCCDGTINNMKTLAEFTKNQIAYVEKLGKNYRQMLDLKQGDYNWERHFLKLQKKAPYLRTVGVKEMQTEIYCPKSFAVSYC